jgi:hypothetical protein
MQRDSSTEFTDKVGDVGITYEHQPIPEAGSDQKTMREILAAFNMSIYIAFYTSAPLGIGVDLVVMSGLGWKRWCSSSQSFVSNEHYVSDRERFILTRPAIHHTVHITLANKLSVAVFTVSQHI